MGLSIRMCACLTVKTFKIKYQHACHVLTNEISIKFYLGPMGKTHTCFQIILHQNSVNKTPTKETRDICPSATLHIVKESLRLDLNYLVQVFHPCLTSIRSIEIPFKASDMSWS